MTGVTRELIRVLDKRRAVAPEALPSEALVGFDDVASHNASRYAHPPLADTVTITKALGKVSTIEDDVGVTTVNRDAQGRAETIVTVRTDGITVTMTLNRDVLGAVASIGITRS